MKATPPVKIAKPFAWSDAWIFAALQGADDESGQVALWKLIAVADMLNHAIVSVDELRQALLRLHGSGLVQVVDGQVFRTSLADSLHRKVRRMRGGMFSIVDNALKVLNSARTSLPVVERAPDLKFLTRRTTSRAHREYVSAISSIQPSKAPRQKGPKGVKPTPKRARGSR